MNGLVERLTNMVAFLKHHGEFPGGQDLLDEAASRITALEAENELMKAALGAYCKAYDEGTGTVHVNKIIRQALGGHHDAD